MASSDEPEGFRFEEIPVAGVALAGQGPDLLTGPERDAIQSYALNGFERINKALWDQTPIANALAQCIDAIRSGLMKYPLPTTVRVTREDEARNMGIVSDESAYALIDRKFTHLGFLSASGTTNPPRSTRHTDPVILDLIVPAGTPALRLGELAEIPDEREVLLIDARSYFVVGVAWDQARSMWRIHAIVTEDER
ncbi:ADP-ribosyltransferase [Nocardia sp. NPDC058705]|uniref:ADP-ribosyltransferase n=1 Tax=Nocardia sp. NPDC058705 TaxID=3346609 RepID=UPI0036B26339